MEMRYEGQRYDVASRCYLTVPPVCASGGDLTHPLAVAYSVEDDPVGRVRRSDDGVSEIFTHLIISFTKLPTYSVSRLKV